MSISRGLRRNHFLRKYGLSLEAVERMYATQKGLCPICKKAMTLGGRRTKDTAVIDHCHRTNKKRGLICFACNIGLGMFKDDVDLLISAVIYLNLTKGGSS